MGNFFPVNKHGRMKFGFRAKKVRPRAFSATPVKGVADQMLQFTNFEPHPTEPNL